MARSFALPNLPQETRKTLREGKSPSLQRRRRVALFSAVGLLDFTAISLYQLGVLRRLPDLPGRIFDSNQVNASPRAYPLGIPDGPLGATQYALNMVLAGAGGQGKGRHPLWGLLLGASALAGALGATKYLWDMVTKEKKACPYCLVGAGVNGAILWQALPEAREAWRTWRRK